jgi:hypothetical protein
MKIVALLSVKDEVEVISASINQLRSIGVDLIIAYDDGSRDGTLDVLEALTTNKNDLWVVHVDRVGREAVTESWRLTWARRADADWVLFSDADELWIPATGSLRDCCSLANTDILTVDRFNVPLTQRGPLVPDELSPSSYEDLLLCVGKIPDFHLSIEQHPDTPWILGAPIGPKVLARRDVIGTVATGGHSVEAIGDRPPRRARPPDLLIAHLPFTTFERFERKVTNITEMVRATPEFFSGYVAWHWWRWASILEAGHLREEFERQVFSDQLLSDLLNAGVIRAASAIFERAEVRPD